MLILTCVFAAAIHVDGPEHSLNVTFAANDSDMWKGEREGERGAHWGL